MNLWAKWWRRIDTSGWAARGGRNQPGLRHVRLVPARPRPPLPQAHRARHRQPSRRVPRVPHSARTQPARAAGRASHRARRVRRTAGGGLRNSGSGGAALPFEIAGAGRRQAGLADRAGAECLRPPQFTSSDGTTKSCKSRATRRRYRNRQRRSARNGLRLGGGCHRLARGPAASRAHDAPARDGDSEIHRAWRWWAWILRR